ncbi:MAG: methionine--tRNA ligase [Candidatus Liptonbacteria bacterium]
MSNKFYITTTLPYVNAAPHIGFALEIVQADVLARYARLRGRDVVFNTGTDEHGLKIYRKALEEGKEPQIYADENAAKFERLKKALNVGYTNFIRTTDPHHLEAAQDFWQRCEKSGDIYKKFYKIKYCVGCELEKTESELVAGRCPVHPNLNLEEIEEENYFFRFSKYQKPLLELYAKYPDFVVPDYRLTEIKNFVSAGLQDFSISRLKEKMPWGIPVPGDDAHVMYVWFDALINYISTIRWPKDEKYFESFWGTKDHPEAVQVAGKDNLRQQSAIWQAMLLSAGVPTSRRILIHGFVTSEGEKISKSRGNVVDPFELVEKYGTDALRYWLTREMPTFDDGDFTKERFEEAYNAGLANGLGNLASRIMKMASFNRIKLDWEAVNGNVNWEEEGYAEYLETAQIQQAADLIWRRVRKTDQYIQEKEPFKLIKTNPEAAKKDILVLLSELWMIAHLLEPFLPETSARIVNAIKDNHQISQPLFPRIA